MISLIEEEFYKIITPIISYRSEVSTNIDDFSINIDKINNRDKINLINNIKAFFKNNLNNPALSVLFSKHLSIIFSDILFKSLDDTDQNVRIVADESINFIIRLNSNQYSPYVIYNLFTQLKNNFSARSINAGLHKFSILSHLIKYSKRQSYVNNVLPVLKIIVSRPEESILLSLVDSMPLIAENLFRFSNDSDIELSLIIPILRNLQNTEVVSQQRNFGQLIAIICLNLKDSTFYLKKLFQYCVSVNYGNEIEITYSLLMIKSLLITCCDKVNFEEVILVLLRIIEIIERDSTTALKNLALDCLLQLLKLKHCTILIDFLQLENAHNIYFEKLNFINHETIFSLSDIESEKIETDDSELTDAVTVEEETLFTRFQTTDIFESDIIDDDDHYQDNEETSFFESTTYREENEAVNEAVIEESLGIALEIYNDSMDSASMYIAKLMIMQFLPDCIDNNSPLAFLKIRNIRVNSKVLAINCLSQLSVIDFSVILIKLPAINGTCDLPTVFESVSLHCHDEDSQLGGSAVYFVGQVVQLALRYIQDPNESKLSVNVDYVKLVKEVHYFLENPISGQHVKFVLSAVKLFLWDLISTDDSALVFKIIQSVLQFANHNYKLVRKEVISVCRRIDFRSVTYLEQYRHIPGLRKNMTVAEHCISVILSMLSDVEFDVMEDACNAIKDLINNGAFDDRYSYNDPFMIFNTEVNTSILSYQKKLIPFLSSDINIGLLDIRKKLDQLSSSFSTENLSGVHRSFHVVIEQFLSIPIPSVKEMKTYINNINGCASVLMMILERFPFNTHPQLWLRHVKNSKKSYAFSTTTNHLLSHCISLLNIPSVTSHMSLHANILHIITRLTLHEGIEHLLSNNLLTEKTNSISGIVLHLNADLPFVGSLKLMMVHLCRVLNIFWHVFQFITPVIPVHKTVLPNLSSQTSVNPPKKKPDTETKSTDTPSSVDSRPPRSRSCLGFFVNHPHYMLMHKTLTVAYNSFLISSDSSNYSEKILTLLSKTLESLSIILEMISFNEVSPYVEEFLAYCSVFYNILPTQTAYFIIKLLGSLFGTNITAQWDAFFFQVYSFMAMEIPKNDSFTDISKLQVHQWSILTQRIGAKLQELLKNASISKQGIEYNNIEKWDECLSDTFQWVRASGKRREPGILRQMVSVTSVSRPNLSHYIGMFEKHVFQCMRQYLASPPELQTAIIQLLCQLIYLRVNYCQLDSEQNGERKFLNIIFNQLENFSSSHFDLEDKSSLIIEIIEFLILITYEKAGPNKRDQPILSLTQVIHSVESLLLNGVSVHFVIIPCMWKIVGDLFVHRSVWINNPGNFNLLPNTNTTKEIEVQREAVLDLILRKLLKYPEVYDILAIIMEHSARQHEEKWEKLSEQVWTKVSSILALDEIEFSNAGHIDQILRLMRLISIKAISKCDIVDMALKYDLNILQRENKDSQSMDLKYRKHIFQSIRSVMSLHFVMLHRIDLLTNSSISSFKISKDLSTKKFIYSHMIEVLHSMISSHTSFRNFPNSMVNEGYIAIELKLLRMLLLTLIDFKKLDQNSEIEGELSVEDSDTQLITMDQYFRKLKEQEFDILALWNELKYLSGIYQNVSITIYSRATKRMFFCNQVRQICRHLKEVEVFRHRKGVMEDFVSEYYIMLLQLSCEPCIRRILHIISINEDLSVHFVKISNNYIDEIGKITSLSMKWLAIVEKLHPLSSHQIMDLLLLYITTNKHDIRSVSLMKVDMILCSRFIRISISTNKTASILTLVASFEEMVSKSQLSLPQFSAKLLDYRKSSNVSDTISSTVSDPLTNIDPDGFDEKKFWRICVEKSLVNHEQDVRLGPRLLQGGTVNDLEDIFNVTLSSTDIKTKENLDCDIKYDSQMLSHLPAKFIQQCLRLGFLRSGGGGIMQEGVRVDVIFRLGEKLMFQQLSRVVEVTKECLSNNDYAILDNSVVVGLLAALNDYLSLSCQLSVPMPVSSVEVVRLMKLIENLCLLIISSSQICSRSLTEEILVLMTSCFCPSTILTTEDMKIMGQDLSWTYLALIVDFLYFIMGQLSRHQLSECNTSSLSILESEDITINTVRKVNRILKICLQGALDKDDHVLHHKLKSAIFTVVRLPLLIKVCRNPNNIRTSEFRNTENINSNSFGKDVLELDCLSRMNRDDLASAQTLIGNIGWTCRFMFEETWLTYLNLLHDKGPSATISGKDDRDVPLSPEEVVEQGHCDSLGLLGVTHLLLKTTARPCPGNPVDAQLEHRTRDKTPNLLHTKIGRKLSTIHGQLDEEIFCSHRGFKMILSGWTISSWNIEREDSILQYRHDQINVNVLAKRITIGSRSPQISGADSNNLDVLSCLQSLPIIYEQWLQLQHFDDTKKSVALWPRACALRSSVILMDLFSSREQVQWLFDCLLELRKSTNIEDDWITLSWLCIGLSKCVSVLETSSNATMPQNAGKPQSAISTSSIYGLLQTVKMIESCLNSDLTILQQSALHSAMFLLQMTVYGKASWDLPTGSLVELKNLHEMVTSYLETQLLMTDPPTLPTVRGSSFSDVSSEANSNSLSQAMSTGAANFASTVSGLTSINNVNMVGASTGSNILSTQSSMPRLIKTSQGLLIRSERHNHLILAASCFYCENCPDALKDSDLLNNFVTLAKNVMQSNKVMYVSATSMLVLCRCLERCFLTQRVSILVIEQIIRICSYYLKTCKSITYSLPVLRLFLTSCYLSLANSLQGNLMSGVFESVFYNGPTNSNGENALVMLERVNIFWKRLTDPEVMDVVESRILSRLISTIMTEFMSGEEVLNKTIHQLLRSWPKAQYVAKTLFDIVTRCLNQPDGEKLIRKWTLMVLPSLTSCRPINLSVWVTTVVLVASASSSRISLRAIFSQCLDWLTHFELGDENIGEIETCLYMASFAFIRDMSRDKNTEPDNKAAFFKAIHANLDIPSFQKLYSLCVKKKLV